MFTIRLLLLFSLFVPILKAADSCTSPTATLTLDTTLTSQYIDKPYIEGDADSGEALFYKIVLPQNGEVQFYTQKDSDNPADTVNTYGQLLDENCALLTGTNTEISTTPRYFKIDQNLSAGTYYLRIYNEVSLNDESPDLAKGYFQLSNTFTAEAEKRAISFWREYPSSITSGDALTFHVYVKNYGTYATSDVEVTIPDFDDYLNYNRTENSSAWNCTKSSNALTCILNGGVLQQGESASFDAVYLSTLETSTHTLSNTADVDIVYNDSTTLSKTHTASVTINKQTPSIAVTNTGTQHNSDTTLSSVIQGDPFDYKITVSNDGSLRTNSITVTDTIPSAYTIDSIDAGSFSCTIDAQNVECTLSTLEAGSSESFRIHVTATGSSGAINNASVTASTELGNVNDSDAASVDIVPKEYKLSLQKSVAESQLIQGHTTSYNLKVTNIGNMPLSSVTLDDTIPSQLSLVGIDETSAWNCDASDIAANRLSCTLQNQLQPGDSQALSLTVRGESIASDVINTASASATSAAGVTDTAILDIVAPQPAVTIDKTAPGDVKSMEKFYYTFVVSNSGTEPLDNIVIKDNFDTQLTLPDDWNDAVAAPWSCTKSANSVTCHYGETLSEGSATSILKLKAKAPFTTEDITIDNSVQVDANYTTSATVTDTDSAQISVSKIIKGVTLTKSVDQGSVYSGEDFTYTLRISNSGTIDQDSIKVIDQIPALLAASFSINSNGFDCSASHDSYVSCSLATLEAGSSKSFTIDVTAPVVTAPVTVTNEANVSAHIGVADHLDEILTHNGSVDVTILPPHSELAIDKTASQDIVMEEDTFSYTISVKNEGIGEESNLTVTDTVPSDLTLLSVTGGSWNCTTDKNDLRCTLLALPASATADDITIQVQAPRNIPSDKSVTNTATVTSAQKSEGISDNASVTLLSDYNAINLHISSNPTSVFAGDLYNYRIKLTNNSGRDIERVTLTDPLPEDVGFDHAESNGWNCSYSESNRTLTCDNNGTAFSPGDHAIDLYVTAPHYETNVTNTIFMNSSIVTQDQNASVVTYVKARDAHLAFTKATTDKNPVKTGETYSYIFAVTNLADTPDSDINATDINITIRLDHNESFQAIHATGWDCQQAENITCTLPWLAQHQLSSQIVIDVVSTLPGERVTEASVRAKESLEDRNTTLHTTVKEVVQTDMILKVTDTPDPVESETIYTYDFTLTNTHPEKSVEGIILDINTTSAEHFTPVDYEDATLWSCLSIAENMRCTLNTPVAANSDLHFQLNVKAPAVATEVEINATLSSEYLDDTDKSNNTVHESTSILKTDLTQDTAREFTRVPIQGDEDTNIYGDILSIGNQSVCEQDSAGRCIEPSYKVNDLIEQKNINLDPTHASEYQNATTATLNLQPDDQVIWAGLYWMGRIDKTKSGATTKMKKAATVYLRHESEERYKRVLSERSATAIDNNGSTISGIDKFNYINDNFYFDYQGMADVTDYVQKHRGGAYWVADVQVSEGDNISAGWNLVVIVMDTAEVPTRELRNITVFDGFQGVWKSPDNTPDKYPDEVNQSVSGFLTPSYGAIDSKIYMFAFEGDKTLDDYITITDKSDLPHLLTDTLNPANDVVNGTLSHTGTVFMQRNPALLNSSGIDIDVFALGDINGSGIIQNDQRSTKITIGSGDGTDSADGGDRFFLGMFAFSTNLHQPLCYTRAYKTADFSADLPAEISLGEEIGIEVEIRNKEVQDIDNLKIYTAINPVLKEDNSSFELKNIDSSGNLESSYHEASELFDFDTIKMSADQNQTEVTLRAGFGADNSSGGKLFGEKKLFYRYRATVDALNDENSSVNILKVSYNPTNKKIMIPPCGEKTTFPTIKENHTNGFNTIHKDGLADSAIDGLTNGDPSQPNNEKHLFTQVAQTPFQIDVLALDDNNPTYLRPTPFQGIAELELVEYNSSTSCQNYTPIKTEDLIFNGTNTLTKSFTAEHARKNALFRVRYLVDKYGRLIEWSNTTLSLTNLKNILQNSAQQNICTAACLGSSATLQSCKACLFKRIDQGGMAKLSCSSDTFAVKPQQVSMDINSSTPLVGAAPYDLLFDANSSYYDPTIDSGSGALNFQLMVPSGCTLPPASGNLLTSTLAFHEGKATLSGFKYPNVGKIKIDYLDKIWTYYDQNATDANMSDCIINSSTNIPDSSGRVGCDVSGSHLFTFVPQKFTSTATFAPSVGSQVYISNDLAMSGILNLTFAATLQDNSIATNYSGGCFANDINFTLSVANPPEDWNSRADINSSILFDGSTLSPQHLGGGTFKVPQTQFYSGISAAAPVKINYSRKRTVPQDPFIVYKNDFNMSVIDTAGVTGGDFDKSSNQGVKYLYARLYATTIKTDKTAYDVPLYYEAYCKDCNRSKYFPASTRESLDSVNWYIINSLHTSPLQGQIHSVTAQNGTQIGTVSLNKIPVSLGSLSAPHRDRILFKPDAWLQFNKYKESQQKSHFDLYFFPPAETWGGKGDIGHTIDLNISNTNRESIDW